MKPGDAFLGVIDFFSTLVPGAVAAFLLLNQDLLSLPSGWPLKWASTEGWAVFVVSAYLLGHGIAAASSLLLDGPVYDRIYVRWKRTKYVRWPMKGRANVCRERAKLVWRKSDPDYPLLTVSKVLKRLQLFDLLDGTGQSSKDVSNTLTWAQSIVRLKSPAGATEIESLQAQSKMFRSIVVIVLAMIAWPPFPTWSRIVILFLFFCLSLWRFCKLRWEASQRTYEYFIGSAIPTDSRAEVARLAYSYWQERGNLDEAARQDWSRAKRELKGS